MKLKRYSYNYQDYVDAFNLNLRIENAIQQCLEVCDTDRFYTECWGEPLISIIGPPYYAIRSISYADLVGKR